MTEKPPTKSKGNLQTFPVSAGLLDPRHVQAIDPSSPWPIYLWFVEHVTRDEENGEQFDGIVSHGRPVSIQQIADALGIGERVCRRHLARLVKARYVLQKKTGVGTCTYTVTNSKRWAWKRQSRAGRDHPSKPPELQADLFSPAQGASDEPSHQSATPKAGIRPQAQVPRGLISVGPDQKQASAENGSRARSQLLTKTLTHTPRASESSEGSALDELVHKIAAENPRLAHLKDRLLPQIQEHAIAEAIVRDGPELVLEGTRRLRDAASRLPQEDRRFIPNPVRFYQQSEYRPDSDVWDRLSRKQPGSPGHVPLPSDYVPASEKVRQELELRRRERLVQ
jgi:hypothetical protein